MPLLTLQCVLLGTASVICISCRAVCKVIQVQLPMGSRHDGRHVLLHLRFFVGITSVDGNLWRVMQRLAELEWRIFATVAAVIIVIEAWTCELFVFDCFADAVCVFIA